MKTLSTLFAASLLLGSTIAVAEEVEVDFISGSEYAAMYQEMAAAEGKFIGEMVQADFANDELDVDFISGSEYVAMALEAKK